MYVLLCILVLKHYLLHDRFDVPSMSLLWEMFTFTFLLSNESCLKHIFGGFLI